MDQRKGNSHYFDFKKLLKYLKLQSWLAAFLQPDSCMLSCTGICEIWNCWAVFLKHTPRLCGCVWLYLMERDQKVLWHKQAGSWSDWCQESHKDRLDLVTLSVHAPAEFAKIYLAACNKQYIYKPTSHLSVFCSGVWHTWMQRSHNTNLWNQLCLGTFWFSCSSVVWRISRL